MKRRPPTVVPTTRSMRAAPPRTSSSTPRRASTAMPVGWGSGPAPPGPGEGARSSPSTTAPSRASNAAAASPAVPAPTMPTRRIRISKRRHRQKTSGGLNSFAFPPTDRNMTSIRNLALAVRLGGAFGALCLALAIVAFTGMHAMNGLSDKSDELAARHLRAAQLVGGMRARAKDNLGLIAQHLYVHNGDLAAEDAILRHIEANWAKSASADSQLEKLFAGTPAAESYARFTATRAQLVKLQKQVLTMSRAETVRGARSRSGSRDAFDTQLVGLDAQLDAVADKLATHTDGFAAAGVNAAHAANASGQHVILAITLLAVLASIGLAISVTRS